MKITREFVELHKGKRFNIVLKDGTTLNKIGFFNTELFPCYMNSRQKSTGRAVPYNWDIVKIEEVKKDKPTVEGNVKKILRRLHKNVWSNLREEYSGYLEGEEISNDFRYHFLGELKFRNISSLLNSQEKENLKKAFENKEECNWFRKALKPQGRDLSISTKVCDDGIFRAWFSSEFAGCGNGDYYLLLSPTTAIYYERD